MMSEEAFLIGSVVQPIALMTFCRWWWRDRKYVYLFVYGTATAFAVYFVDLNRFGILDGGFKSLTIGMSPILGGWLYQKYFVYRGIKD